jgi:hypothetical protein
MRHLVFLLPTLLLVVGCGPNGGPSAAPAPASQVSAVGSIEVTARLVEVPEGAIFKRDLYDYATVLKYEVETVHRGSLTNRMIQVAHYNPFRPRAEAADARVKNLGGNLERFVAGQRHRLALDGTADEQFMGGMVNKYFGQNSDPIHWAIWTDLVP